MGLILDPPAKVASAEEQEEISIRGGPVLAADRSDLRRAPFRPCGISSLAALSPVILVLGTAHASGRVVSHYQEDPGRAGDAQSRELARDAASLGADRSDDGSGEIDDLLAR